jgi:hypothetical protein
VVVRTTPGGTQVTGTPIPVSFGNGVAGGWIGYLPRTSDQTSITSVVDVSGVTVTVTVNTSRRLKISGRGAHLATNADTVAQLSIKEGGTTLDFDRSNTAFANVSYNKAMTPQAIVTPSAGSHTYKLTIERTVGTGTITLVADVDRPCFILVEDMGPA